jgi:transcription elongation factor Elf1
MMNKKNGFFELYKHPNWQKRRLEIMEKSNFECLHCGTKDKTLNVHHLYYENGLKPWEYPDDSLICLCSDCHLELETKLKSLRKKISRISYLYIDEITGFVDGIFIKEMSDGDYSLYSFKPYPFDVYSFEHALGIAKYFEINVGRVLNKSRELKEKKSK